jgi:signal transduction histidine kinase
MFRNRIAWKLAGYFAAAILVFAVVMSIVFGHFFKENTVNVTKRDLQDRADKVAVIMGDNYDRLKDMGLNGGHIGSRRLISYINTITRDDVWVVTPDQNVEIRNHVPPAGVKNFPGNFSMPKEEFRGAPGMNFPPVVIGVTTVGDLPQPERDLIKNTFKGRKGVLETFDKKEREVMVTASAPVYSRDGGIVAVLLLRTPMVGLRESWESGLSIFLWSILTSLLLALIVAAVLSLKFTKPLNKMKNTAISLANKDYKARSYVHQHDEIGELGTTLDSLAGRLEKADTETKELDKLRREFIANVSHELRTPVTVLRSSLEALRDKVVTKPEDVDRYHDTMYKETLFLQRLITDLLELSRLQNAGFAIEKKPLNFCEVIQDAVRSGRHLGHDKNITVTYTGDANVYKMIGDYGRLNQMLLVFLDNAVKFSPEGSSIEILLKGQHLTIADHGCGISKKDLLHIFDRFYKSRVEKNKSGSGLGLAIAREIAERHGIIPTVHSEEGKGTTIELFLPVAGTNN